MTVGVRSVGGAAAVLRARLQRHRDSYAFCPEDRFWFRPLYTAGKCPLCGEAAAEGAPPLPLLVRFDRFWVGMGALTLVSLGMSALVLYMYFKS